MHHHHPTVPPRTPPPLARRRNRRVKPRTGPGVLVQMGHGLRAVFPTLLALIIVLGLGIGAVEGWRRISQSPYLRVRAIDVHGTHRATSAEIIAYTGVKLGQPILACDLDAMALNLRRHPWVRTASVRRRLPDRLVVEVAEHTPTMLVSLGDLYIADEDGQPFKIFSVADQLVLPVITGMEHDDATRRMPYVADRIRAGIGLAEAVQSRREIFGELEELHWDHDLGWSIVLAGAPPLRIHLGQEPVDRLPRAARALQLVEDRHASAAVIWADGEKNQDRVQVQLNGGSRGTKS